MQNFLCFLGTLTIPKYLDIVGSWNLTTKPFSMVIFFFFIYTLVFSSCF